MPKTYLVKFLFTFLLLVIASFAYVVLVCTNVLLHNTLVLSYLAFILCLFMLCMYFLFKL